MKPWTQGHCEAVMRQRIAALAQAVLPPVTTLRTRFEEWEHNCRQFVLTLTDGSFIDLKYGLRELLCGGRIKALGVEVLRSPVESPATTP